MSDQTGTQSACDGNTRHRTWFLTINNPTEEEENTIKSDNCEYIYQIEKGTNNTEHIQAILGYKNACKFSRMKSMYPRAHIQVVRNDMAAKLYCCKEKTRIRGPYASTSWEKYTCLETKKEYANRAIGKPKDKYINWVPAYDELEHRPISDFHEDWQKEIIKICDSKPDYRTIHVYVDYTGNTGKSSLAKTLKIKHRDGLLTVTGGKANDLKHIVAKKVMSTPKGETKKMNIIWDITRSQEGCISYQCIEELKNGYFTSTKYDGTEILMNSPNIIMLMNWMPDLDKLSKDRWKITEINKKPSQYSDD